MYALAVSTLIKNIDKNKDQRKQDATVIYRVNHQVRHISTRLKQLSFFIL
jgi:hypothetical protein